MSQQQLEWFLDQEKYLTYAQSVYKEAYGQELNGDIDYNFDTLLDIIKAAELHIISSPQFKPH